MTLNFLAPAKPGKLIGEANVTQLGKTVAFVEGRLMAEDGTVLATATTSARLVGTRRPSHRRGRTPLLSPFFTGRGENQPASEIAFRAGI